MSSDKARFTTRIENIARLGTFEKNGVLIVCTFCGECALIRAIENLQTIPGTRSGNAVCVNCGRSWSLPYDYEDLPLWLSTDVRNHHLWALNESHLQWLENFIEARLREDKVGGSSAMHAVLPRWMTASKNRVAVTKALSRLREKLPVQASK